MSGRRWVLICAVANYQDQSMEQLPGAVQDAATFWWTLDAYADGGVYRHVYLQDTEATKEKMLEELATIAQYANVNDQVVFYFTGHGDRYPNADGQYVYCLLPHEASFATAASQGLTIAEVCNVLTQLSATQIVLIFDCCYSGGLLNDFQHYLNSVSASRGNMYLMAAARKSELSYEYPIGGVFTQALCVPLRGEGVTPNHLGQISAQAAAAHAYDIVTKHDGLKQHPVFAGYGENIYLTRRNHPLPKPRFQHPYAADKYFVGRAEERSQLTKWFMTTETDSLLVIDAIGGMGKSALVWKWVHDDLLKMGLHPDGVFFWSFYDAEATFEHFVDAALRYFGIVDVSLDAALTVRWQRLAEVMTERRCLVILDGVERLLNAYHPGSSGHPRDCISPSVSQFLLYFLAHAERGKLLLVTTLPLRELENAKRWRSLPLQPLSKIDVVPYFRASGVSEARATRAEIDEAGKRLGYHPLALSRAIECLLNDPTGRRNLHDITLRQLNLVPLEPQRSHHVLAIPYLALDPSVKALLSSLAAFQRPMALAVVKQVIEETRFRKVFRRLGTLFGAILGISSSSILTENDVTLLMELGFLQRTDNGEFILPPLIQAYAYAHLLNKDHTHRQLYYFFASQGPSVVGAVTAPQDLNFAIEQYHQTVQAGRFDEAFDFFSQNLEGPLYHELKAHALHQQLLKAFFPDGLDHFPQLTNKKARAWVMNALANSYARSGRAREAVQFYERHNRLQEYLRNDADLIVGLRNRAEQELLLGNIAAAEEQLQRSIDQAEKLNDATTTAASRQTLSLLFSYKGEFDRAAEMLVLASSAHQQTGDTQASFIDVLYRSRRALLMGDSTEALESARLAWRMAETAAETRAISDYDTVEARWLLGAALVAQTLENETDFSPGQDSTTILTEAESHLNHALELCQERNYVEWEAQILITQAHLKRRQGKPQDASRLGQEALHLATRCEYRLQQAEAHNILARLHLDTLNGQRIDRGDTQSQRALALASEHAANGKERAWCDGQPHCYAPALEESRRLLTRIQKIGEQ